MNRNYNFIIAILFFILVPIAQAQLYPLEPKELEEELWKISEIEGMVFVKGGCYQMGDTFGDGDSDEKPVHEVCVDDFYIGKYEVTQGQWKEIMGSNPSYFKNCGDNCPVDNVSWDDVQYFINKLNQKKGKKYRLPTEAEWEYGAGSGGKKEKFAGTSSETELGEFAWYGSNSGKQTHPVGQKKPNGLGLYDMSGNIWEWVQDWYDSGYYNTSPRNNPTGLNGGSIRVLRGGSRSNNPWLLCTAIRSGGHPDNRDLDFGVRLVGPAR